MMQLIRGTLEIQVPPLESEQIERLAIGVGYSFANITGSKVSWSSTHDNSVTIVKKPESHCVATKFSFPFGVCFVPDIYHSLRNAGVNTLNRTFSEKLTMMLLIDVFLDASAAAPLASIAASDFQHSSAIDSTVRRRDLAKTEYGDSKVSTSASGHPIDPDCEDLLLASFAKFITTLSKFGDDLYLDFQQDKLCLSTFNSAKSAFAIISIQRSFFESFAFSPVNPCHRLLLKPLSNILKSTGTESVSQCCIKPVSESGEERLLVQLVCKYGIIKSHRLNYETCEPVHVIFSKASCPHRWSASPRMIHDLLGHFQQKLKDVTLSCGINWFKIKSFEDTFIPDGTTVVRSLETEITVDIEEFELYQVFGETHLTFELKDLKAVLSFAESVDLPVTAFFDKHSGPTL
eukprot:jgi/Hompol1/1490/HPOL_005613-RA